MFRRYIIFPLVFGVVLVMGLALLEHASIAEALDGTVIMSALQDVVTDRQAYMMVGVLFLLVNFCSLVVSFMKTGRRPN